MLEAIRLAIATAANLEEIEAIQMQLQDLVDEAQERYEELEIEAEEAQAAIDAAEEAQMEAEEAERTGAKEKDLKITTSLGEAAISKHKKTWEILLLHDYYGQCHYLSLPSSTPEAEVREKSEFYLNEWPFEIHPYCGWYSSTKVEVSAEEILAKGLEAARQEKLNLLFPNN